MNESVCRYCGKATDGKYAVRFKTHAEYAHETCYFDKEKSSEPKLIIWNNDAQEGPRVYAS